MAKECGKIGIRKQKQGLLSFSEAAREERRKFMALRRVVEDRPSDGAQLKYFLLYSSIGVTCMFAFGGLFFFTGIAGL